MTILECTALQPVCSGTTANSYEHTDASTSVGDKRTPSNGQSAGASALASSSSGNTKSTATTTATSAAALAFAVVTTALFNW